MTSADSNYWKAMELYCKFVMRYTAGRKLKSGRMFGAEMQY